jgi:hypothetical protein
MQFSFDADVFKHVGPNLYSPNWTCDRHACLHSALHGQGRMRDKEFRSRAARDHGQSRLRSVLPVGQVFRGALVNGGSSSTQSGAFLAQTVDINRPRARATQHKRHDTGDIEQVALVSRGAELRASIDDLHQLDGTESIR